MYSITVTVADGYTGDYTFVNGPDWPFKENRFQVKIVLSLRTTIAD